MIHHYREVGVPPIASAERQRIGVAPSLLAIQHTCHFGLTHALSRSRGCEHVSPVAVTRVIRVWNKNDSHISRMFTSPADTQLRPCFCVVQIAMNASFEKSGVLFIFILNPTKCARRYSSTQADRTTIPGFT